MLARSCGWGVVVSSSGPEPVEPGADGVVCAASVDGPTANPEPPAVAAWTAGLTGSTARRHSGMGRIPQR